MTPVSRKSVPSLVLFSLMQSTHSFIHSETAFVAPRLLRSSIILDALKNPPTESFIQNELRGAAMKLHTRVQAPKEGEVEEKPQKPYDTTHADYLSFLVDSQHVYQAFEDIVNERSELKAFRKTGLERVSALEKDIDFMTTEYNLERPDVRSPGRQYAEALRQIKSIPEFVCHFYNHYFAHTAGGRMIGKKMSSSLLDKKTLEFYKWDDDLNAIKDRTKQVIEDIAAKWSAEERQECADATAAAFTLGGAINSHLSGRQSSQ